MKGDIAFAGFVLTADEWRALDTEARAQLVAVATRRADPWLAPPPVMPEGSGPHDPMMATFANREDSVVELDELELVESEP